MGSRDAGSLWCGCDFGTRSWVPFSVIYWVRVRVHACSMNSGSSSLVVVHIFLPGSVRSVLYLKGGQNKDFFIKKKKKQKQKAKKSLPIFFSSAEF